jgi:hypothetical protein
MGALLDPVTWHTVGFREAWRKVVVKCIVIMMNRISDGECEGEFRGQCGETGV